MRENYLKVRWKQTRKREKTIGENPFPMHMYASV